VFPAVVMGVAILSLNFVGDGGHTIVFASDLGAEGEDVPPMPSSRATRYAPIVVGRGGGRRGLRPAHDPVDDVGRGRVPADPAAAHGRPGRQDTSSRSTS
jgi:hypothetical protein